MEGDLFLSCSEEERQLLERYKEVLKSDPYINTEILRFHGFLDNAVKTLLDIINIDIKRSIHGTPEYIKGSQLVGIRTDKILEFLTYKHDDEEEELFALYLGIRCIMGRRKEAENINHALVFARASGNMSTKDELHPRIKKYNTRRMKDKYRVLLSERYGISFYQSKSKRGFAARLYSG